MIAIKNLVLFCLFLASFTPAQAGPKVTIVAEKARVQQILRTLFGEQVSKGASDILGPNEPIEEYKQYLSLLDLKYKLELRDRQVQNSSVESGESTVPVEPQVGIGFFGQLRGVLAKLRENRPNLSIESAYRLFSYLEENKRLWRQAGAPPPTPFMDNDVKVGISLTAHGKILLSISEQFIVKGITKGVDQGIGYKKGHGLTRLRSYDSLALQEMGIKYEGPEDEEPIAQPLLSAPLNQPAQEGKLTKEASILLKIKNAEPHGPKRGLVDLFSGNHDEIVVHSLDGDLEDLYPEETPDGKTLEPKLDLTRLSNVQRLEGVSQLTDGLALLKSLGYVHSDLKFSNILHQGILPKAVTLPLEQGLFQFKYCDFGEAIFMPEVDLNNRPVVGNVFFMPPEVAERLWYGTTEEEIRELGYRADVFSHALVSYYLLNLRYFPGLLEADAEAKQLVAAQARIGPKVSDNLTYLNRRKQYIEKELSNDLYSQDYDSATHLIYRSIATDPRERPSMEQFQAGINYIKTKQSSEKTISAQEIMTSLKDLHIHSYNPALMSQALSSAQRGQFILMAFQAFGKTQYRASVAYMAKSENYRTQLVFKILDVDPSDPMAVRKEIDFLRSIGTLTQQLSFQ